MRKLIYFLVFATSTIISDQENIQTSLPSGAAVKGRLVDLNGKSYSVYKNIPYAEPTGETRFQPSILKNLEGELDATGDSGPTCPQIPSIHAKGVKEDCLHLDIYTPRRLPGDSLLPVMVWIHGGAFIMGSTQDYDPEGILGNLVSRGVIVVPINYRLGPFGFLVNQDIGVTGNLGLLDQILALKWVQANIEAFGGDPEHVTIFGESAGGMSCSLLMFSRLARGLFSQAILMSGAAWPSMEMQFQGMDATSNDFLGLVGCKEAADVLGCLQAAELTNLTSAADQMLMTKGQIWTPIFNDGNVLPGSVEELNMNRLPIPTIVGTTKDEAGLFDLMTMPLVALPYVHSEEGMRIRIDEAVKKDAFGLPVERVRQIMKEELVDKFLAADPENAKDGSHWFQQSVDMRSSDMFHKGAHKEAVALSQKGAPVFLFSFDYFNPDLDLFKTRPGLDWKGSVHGTDLGYMFGVNQIIGLNISLMTPKEMGPADLKIRELFGLLWTNFAKTGNPSEPSEVTWKEFRPEENNYLSLNWPNLEMKLGFHQGMIQLWDKLENEKSAEIREESAPHHEDL